MPIFSVIAAAMPADAGRTSPPVPLARQPLRSQHERPPRAQKCRLTLRFSHPCGEPLELQVTDVSETGLGLLLPHRPLCRIAVGECWTTARLSGNGAAIGPLALEIRHIATTAAGELQIGALILGMSGGALRRLRRLFQWGGKTS